MGVVAFLLLVMLVTEELFAQLPADGLSLSTTDEILYLTNLA